MARSASELASSASELACSALEWACPAVEEACSLLGYAFPVPEWTCSGLEEVSFAFRKASPESVLASSVME